MDADEVLPHLEAHCPSNVCTLTVRAPTTTTATSDDETRYLAALVQWERLGPLLGHFDALGTLRMDEFSGPFVLSLAEYGPSSLHTVRLSSARFGLSTWVEFCAEALCPLIERLHADPAMDRSCVRQWRSLTLAITMDLPPSSFADAEASLIILLMNSLFQLDHLQLQLAGWHHVLLGGVLLDLQRVARWRDRVDESCVQSLVIPVTTGVDRRGRFQTHSVVITHVGTDLVERRIRQRQTTLQRAVFAEAFFRLSRVLPRTLVDHILTFI